MTQSFIVFVCYLGLFGLAAPPFATAAQTSSGRTEQAAAYYLDAVTLNEQDQLRQAIERLEQATRLNPDLAQAFSLKGDIYRRLEDYTGSAEAYKRAFELDPWSFEDALHLGQVCRQRKDFTQAARAFAAAGRLQPENPQALIGAAFCYYELGDYGSARQYARQARQLDLSDSGSRSDLNLLLYTLEELSGPMTESEPAKPAPSAAAAQPSAVQSQSASAPTWIMEQGSAARPEWKTVVPPQPPAPDLWDDPDLQKQFRESYLSETEMQPGVKDVKERDRMQKILDFISEEQIDKALRELKRARGPKASALFDYTIANLYFQQEELDQAEEAYRIAVEKFPRFRQAWRNLGMIYVRQSELEKALPVLLRVMELGQRDAGLYGLIGYTYSMLENPAAAETAYRMAMLLDSESLDWQMGLMSCLFKLEKYSEAACFCDELLKKFPDRTDIWMIQANAFIGLNQPMRAAQVYELVEQLGKSTPAALNTLGDIYVNEGLYEIAVESYIRAMEIDPEATPARAIGSAKALAARAANDETRRLIGYLETRFADQLEFEQHKDLLKLRVRLAAAAGSSEEEVKVLEQIVALDDQDGEALILLGQHASHAGDFDKAIEYFKKAEKLEKYAADAALRHGQTLVSQARYAEAIPLLKQAYDLKPRENIRKYLDQVTEVAKANR